jgi:NAD(P)-dependent dehydrogenase (short-subunit alcohol dehydrogenase family)
MYNPYSLERKTILVTGASSGIGRAIAVECSKMGAQEDERNRLLDIPVSLDGTVHCAGLVKTVLFPFIDAESLSSVMDVNFTAPVLLSAQMVKRKKLSKNSSIVFISSISGNVCVGGNSIYSASKAAINGLMKNMAFDLAAKGIRVNSVCPGMVETTIFDSKMISKEQLEEDRKRYPLKRYGRPEEIAWAVMYLLSDTSKWVTGSSLLIDGGYTLL